MNNNENITYELILKYLTQEKHIFITENNTNNYNFLNKYNSIFSNEYYRSGVLTFDKYKNNISFWTSILLLLENKYFLNNNDISDIILYKHNLIELYSKKISNFVKKYEKNDFKEYLKLNPDIIIIQYIVDILNINIFIFDFYNNDNIIYSIYKNDYINPANDTILLANYQTFWEPIMCDNKKKFNNNDTIIKNVLNYINIKYYSQENINKIFTIYNNSNNNNDINLTIKKLDKMKKCDLVKILNDNNIFFPNKNTNKLLINLIIENNLI
jgi:hypothetical protein